MNRLSTADDYLAAFMQEEELPPSFLQMAKRWYLPLCEEVSEKVRGGALSVLGISGSQGSGKSTLAKLLFHLLQHQFDLKVAVLSLDDFYLKRSERDALATTLHSLFATRGVPGTHDVKLAIDVINHLLGDGKVMIPRFDKAKDDRKPPQHWDAVAAPVDLIILEGWCLCVTPQPEHTLAIPVNAFEQKNDGESHWRFAVNQALAQEYPALFQLVDYLVFLQSPNFESVKRWRSNQEAKLTKMNSPNRHSKVMAKQALEHFMQHYERLTLHGFKVLPEIADIVFLLNEAQLITQRRN